MIDLIFEASPIVQAVMFMLAMSSVISWAVMAFKAYEFRVAEAQSTAFVNAYYESPLDTVYNVARDLPHSPLAALCSLGFKEVAHLQRLQQGTGRDLSADQIDGVCKRLFWFQVTEGQRLGRGLAFLATIGSTAPFIGLFGTVVGIMNSFREIGETGQANLATVGPGIAEALFATAIGLFAAIPAVMAYNYLSSRMARLLERLDAFRTDYESSLRRVAVNAA
jgi:biopolymer transport protein TolQ